MFTNCLYTKSQMVSSSDSLVTVIKQKTRLDFNKKLKKLKLFLIC
jgi:hypothetical protein